LTTGLRDKLLFPHLDTVEPKVMRKCGAERSDDFGSIPNLREPFKPN